MNDRMKKVVAGITTVMTALTMSGVVMLAPMVAGAVTIVDGDLMQNPSAEGAAKYDVYIAKIVGSNNYKRLIVSPSVFDSYGHLSWSKIKTVDQATMDAYTTSDLSRCVDPDFGVDDPKVYKLVADGDTGAKQWLNMTAAEFEAAGYKWDSIYTINKTDRDTYTAGSDITAAETTDDGATAAGTKLTVALAADTAASGIVVSNAARVPFTKINLTASSDGDIVVDSVVVKRNGLGNDAAFSSVDLIDGDTNLPINDVGKTFNSEHKTTFTTDFTVKAGATKSIIVAGNMGSLASYAGETPALAVEEINLTGDAAVNGTLPIVGNVMTTNSTIAIGSAAIERGAYSNATSTTIEVGKTNYVFFSFKIAAGSTEKVQFSQVKIYQEGSASFTTDMENLKLYEEGTKLADATGVTAKYANFKFDTITLDKGQTKQFTVKADVISGSARTIQLGIYRNTDLLVKGVTYGYNITPTYSGKGTQTSPVLHDNSFTVSNGTLQVTRSNDVGAGNISVADDQILGAFQFVCKGEPIDISALTLTITSTSASQVEDALAGVELVDPNGKVVAGPNDLASNTKTVAWTDTFTVPVGTTVYKVRGNLSTSGGWATDNTIYVSFTPSAMTAKGQNTGNAITATPSSSLSANTQTIKAGSLVITRNTMPADSTVIVNQNSLLLSSWNFDASNSGEDVRITSIGFTAKAAGLAATNTNNLTLYINDAAQSPINDAVSDNTSAAQSSTFTLDTPYIIKSGAKATVQLKGDKSTVASNNTENWGLRGNCVTVYGVSTGNEITESITVDDGPTLTSAASGTLTIETDGNPASAIVLAGSTGNVFTYLRLSAKYEDVKLNQITLGVFDGGYGFSTAADAGNEYKDVKNVAIYDGTAKVGEGSISSATGRTFYFNTATSDTLIIPKGGSKTLTIKADMSTVDPDTDDSPGTNSSDIKIYIVGNAAGIKSTGTASNSEITSTSYEIYRDATSSAMVLRSSKPIVQVSSTANPLGAATSLTNGSINLFNFKITADSSGGEVLLYRTTFIFATSGTGMTLTNVFVRDADGNTVKTASTPTDLDAEANSEYYLTVTFNNPDVSLGDADEAIKIASGQSKTFYVWGTVSGAGTGENVSTFLVGDTASTSATVNVSNVANQDGYWNGGGIGWKVPVCDFTTWPANFIWSDNYKNKSISAASSTDATTGVSVTNATGTPMWYNSHLVPGIGNVVTTTSYVIGWTN